MLLWVQRLDRLCRIGSQPHMSVQARRQVWNTNAAALGSVLMTLMFIPMHLVAGAPIRAALLTLSVLCFATVPVLSMAQRHNLARPLLVFGFNACILVMQATDSSSRLWICYIAIACAAMVIFSDKHRFAGYVSALVSIVFAAIAASGMLDPISAALGQPPIPTAIDVAAVAAVMVITPVVIGRMSYQVAQHDQWRIRAVASLRHASEQANAANEAKSAFLANMSHEIRTPLAAVISLTQLARTSEAQVERDEYLTLASQSAKHLLSVVNDVLDLSKIEAGQLSLETEPIDLAALITEVATMARVRCAEKGIQVKIQTDLGPNPWRELDPMRLKQVLLNLLGNSAKFTDSGAIGLRVYARDTRVVFEAWDTGIGMTEQQLLRVFEPFQQAEASTTRKYGGTGLGLTICRQILSLWSSKLEIDSTPGEGTRVQFALELPSAQPLAPVEVVARPEADALRILIAEDNAVNQLIARRILEQQGHKIDVVDHGGLAVDIAHDGYDLVLMDLQMPVMDGLEATRRIRAKEKKHNIAPVPIIALTANAMRSDEERCAEVGMNGHLAKPLNPHLLQEVLRGLWLKKAS
ncbi:MAG: ATP-binding protein [Myxococcota bacterium]